MTLLSVIVPVYNVEKYLSECLDSLVKQTYKNIEIICIDDGSTDGSLGILNEYAQKYNQIKVVSKENSGVASARNEGMKFASGEYLAFVDSDDYVDLNTYEEAMKHKDEADLICFGIKVFGDANYDQRAADDKYYEIEYEGVKTLNDKIILTTDVSSCNKIFNKEIIDKYNINFPNGLNNEDAEFYCKYISCISNAYFINNYYYNYRRTGKSIMSSNFLGSEKAIHHLYIMQNIFEFWKKNEYLFSHKELFSKIFINYFNFAYWNSKICLRSKVLYVASDYAKTFDEVLKSKNNFIKNLKRKKYNDLFEPDLKFYQKLFKVKKIFCLVSRCYRKNLYIFGLRIKLNNKNEELIQKLNYIEDMLVEAKQEGKL